MLLIITCVICIVCLSIMGIVAVNIHRQQHLTKTNNTELLGQQLSNELNLKNAPTVYLCITTIPERLNSPWLEKNIRRLLDVIVGDFKIHYSIPYTTHKGVPYTIPQSLLNLKKQDNRFIIYRPTQDYGPITKVRGALDNIDIPENAPLLICDDDIAYKKYFVTFILYKYLQDTSKIYSYCNYPLEGFKGIMGSKQKLRRIEQNNPPSCFRIDDDVFQLTFDKEEQITVPYGNFNSSWCSLDKNIHDTDTPIWKNALKYDNREPMSKKCAIDFKSKMYKNYQ